MAMAMAMRTSNLTNNGGGRLELGRRNYSREWRKRASQTGMSPARQRLFLPAVWPPAGEFDGHVTGVPRAERFAESSRAVAFSSQLEWHGE